MGTEPGRRPKGKNSSIGPMMTSPGTAIRHRGGVADAGNQQRPPAEIDRAQQQQIHCHGAQRQAQTKRGHLSLRRIALRASIELGLTGRARKHVQSAVIQAQ